jgi:hypothetical protein
VSQVATVCVDRRFRVLAYSKDAGGEPGGGGAHESARSPPQQAEATAGRENDDMSEDSLPVQPLIFDDGHDTGRPGRPGPVRRLAQHSLSQGGDIPGHSHSHTRVASRPRLHDSAGHSRRPGPEPLRLTPAVAALTAIGLGYALVAGGFRKLTIPAELGTFTVGALVSWLALRKDCRRRAAPAHLSGRGLLPWAVVLAVFAVWELYADFRGSTPDHPTLSILMGPALQDPVNRALGYVLWLATGVWVVRR